MEINYKRHQFSLTRKCYREEDYTKCNVGDIVQEANSAELNEFKVLEFKDKEVKCLDLQTNVERFFFKDSIKLHPSETKRRKKEIQFKKKQAKWKAKEEAQKKRATRLLLKLERETAKKNRKLSRKKIKEVTIKFI